MGEPPDRSEGEELFARYAYAPNHLGYCGPAEELLAADVREAAPRFSGAWPYLCVLAELAGIEDPLDARVVRAYWTGGPLLEGLDNEAFGRKLIDRIGAQAGHYWAHLTDGLLPEAAPTHAFHVFGVYPWSRLLTSSAPGPALRVLDSCRIRWGQVVAVPCDQAGESITVRAGHLTWDGQRLGLSQEDEETVRTGFVTDPRPGDWLAVHWDWATDWLTDGQVADLMYWTDRQLAVTNTRLARELAGGPVS